MEGRNKNYNERGQELGKRNMNENPILEQLKREADIMGG